MYAYLQRTARKVLRQRGVTAWLLASANIAIGCTNSTEATSQSDPNPPCSAPTRYEVALPAPADTLIHAIYLQCAVAPNDEVNPYTARTQVRLVNVSGRTLYDVGWAGRYYVNAPPGKGQSNPMRSYGRIRDWAAGQYHIIEDVPSLGYVAPYDSATGGGRNGALYGREIVPLQLLPASGAPGIGTSYAGFWLARWSEVSTESHTLMDTVVIPQQGAGTDGRGGTWITVDAVAGISITWPSTAQSCGGPAYLIPSSFTVRGDTLRSSGELFGQRQVGGTCNPRALLGTGTATLVKIP